MNLIFDLDGTIWDTAPRIAEAWTAVFSLFGISRKVVAQDIHDVMGRPYLECLKIVTGKEEFNDDLLEALNSKEKHLVESNGGVLYEGVEEGIEFLAEKHDLYIVSNCKDWYLDVFLNSKLGSLFKESICFDTFNQPKDKNITHLLDKYSMDIKDSVYIGDTAGDRDAAKKNNLKYFHVLYGGDKGRIGEENFEDFRGLVNSFLDRQEKC